ncbi:ABC transporter substrate-binding protein, partial [Burkholderia sp. SIMBA_024]|uniref:ABC transporter substrate-binding protein n=1 Tax=Burkholderia sp. SIMBA_024 TaxID=3085768 RepID=UPI00397D8875
GAVYGVPQDIGPTGMMYRNDLFDEYGFDVPTTWEEFAEVAEDIREAGDGDMYIANFAGGDADLFVGLTMQAGANWWTVDGDEWKVDIDSQASRDVLAFWQDMVDRDLVSAVPGGTPEWNSMMND